MTRISEYNGKPVLEILTGPDDRYPLSLGLAKLKKILANIKDIIEFVKTDGKATLSQPLVKNQVADDDYPVEDDKDDIPF